ncbi:hypothetical protein L198_04627 [Cryptococcus wingfieldii CBS 7118]|uniref:tRNA ligase n=1 Tax=Cryptococcus wingfieldii CBS 7118 TaxID=1295528 RepID=A0A1E3J313_9TREE|nr:hypothetical protein L198_04627 [Cryptococcus wingfieldii CBS 7118]ODN95239.1 hypothetical protein L198_04627 [Cryptococcus wingfieldii CBS 7118]
MTPTNYTSKHPESLPVLLSALRDLQLTDPKAIRATTHLYPSSMYAPQEGYRDRKIVSWKMTEHMYYKKAQIFPTLARGLFTERLEDGDLMPPGVEEGEERIVLRGYDKFFNVGELAWTEWDSMAKHTIGPYHLTLKSNGCLILISALDLEHLVVASKHSLGTTVEGGRRGEQRGNVAQKVEANETSVEKSLKALDISESAESEQATPYSAEADVATDYDNGPSKSAQKRAAKTAQKEAIRSQKEAAAAARAKAQEAARSGIPARAREEAKEHEEALQHAEVGRQWLKKTLERSGKTEKELARKLWEGNMTAVLELCDDSFEEHVIATPEHWTGLHLHGLNLNTPHFATLPPESVSSIAQEFGFIETKYLTMDTLEEVKTWTDELAKTGSWEGDMIEGFVVRATVKDVPHDRGSPPYKPDAPFFFKVKFEEPYLLYRQFRELTRVLLPLASPDIKPAEKEAVWQAARAKSKRAELKVYAQWAASMMEQEPTLFDDYNKGVVRVRERFLAWTEGEGKSKWIAAREGKVDKVERKNAKEGLPKKWIIVPIAVPGCGKTFIGNALASIYGIGHTQSDDVTTKRSAPAFIQSITSLLLSSPSNIVFADRCNHIADHYRQLAAIASDRKLAKYDVRLIGVTWGLDEIPYYKVLRVLSDRIVARGDNHQTLRPDLSVEAEHEAIVGRFMRNYAPADPEIFETFIQLSVLDNARESLGKVIEGLEKIICLPKPSEEQVLAGIQAAEQYRVTTPYHPAPKLSKPTRFYSLQLEIDLWEFASRAITSLSHGQTSQNGAKAFLDDLRRDQRITSRPHVTLSHETNVKAERLEGGRAAEDGTPLETGQDAGLEETMWETCKTVLTSDYPTLYDYALSYLVWDDRMMAFMLDDLQPASASSTERTADDSHHIGKILPPTARRDLHVTVGTVSQEVNPFESRLLVRQLRDKMERGEEIGESGEGEQVADGGGKVRWLRIQGLRGQGRLRAMG